MKKKVFKVLSYLVLLALFLVPFAFAKTATVEFSFNEAQEHTIDGYRIYERIPSGMVEMLVINDPTLREGTFDVGDEIIECRTFFMTAMRDNIDGNPGNTAALCPDLVLPPMIVKPGTTVNFTINVLP